jgi:hypothetical protein
MSKTNLTWRHSPAALIAVVSLCTSAAAIAEPYSGNPSDDPLVALVTWTAIVAGSAIFSLPISLVVSRAKLDSRRFVTTFAAAFISLLVLAKLAGVVYIAKELVSLVLHVLL